MELEVHRALDIGIRAIAIERATNKEQSHDAGAYREAAVNRRQTPRSQDVADGHNDVRQSKDSGKDADAGGIGKQRACPGVTSTP